MTSSKAVRAIALISAWAMLAASPAPAPFATVVSECANPNLFTLPVALVDAPRVTLRLAVAEDEHTRELGLMCVTHLQARTGMIFVFGHDDRWEFWMKNTLIPLDMVWVRPDGRVDAVAARVPASTRATPDDKVARRTGRGVYVIELAPGEAAADGIVAGSTLKVPKGLAAR
jgi:hypothetical protein